MCPYISIGDNKNTRRPTTLGLRCHCAAFAQRQRRHALPPKHRPRSSRRLSSLGCPPAQSRGANTLPAFTWGRGAWLKTPKDGSDRVARADQHRTDTGQPVAAPLSSLAKAHGARRRDQQRPRAPKEFQPNPPTTTAAAAADERKKTGQREDERLPFSRPRHFFRRSTDAHLTKK